MTGATDPATLVDALLAVEPLAAARRDAIRIVRAPGRVNLIGEHTDYNDGLVLPLAIDREIRIAAIPMDDRRVELTRLDTGQRLGLGLDEGRAPDGSWLDYVAGTAAALLEAGLPVGGLRGVIGSDLPEGAGLSSSAAIELASAWALLGPGAQEIDPLRLAQVAQRAENEYVGVRSGLMDQFAASCGVAGNALYLDCRSLEWRPVPLPPDVSVVVCHTGSSRRLGGSEYNLRREQCEAAVAVLSRADTSVRSLRDVRLELLDEERRNLEPVVARRAEHVITENDRVRTLVAALEAGDTDSIGSILQASHASLRDGYEVSSPELDTLVAIAVGVPGVIGARMTGAGFGGCTINLVETGAVDDLREAVHAQYQARTRLIATVFPVSAAAGASEIRA